MQIKNLSLSHYVIGFMFTCLIFGFLAIGVAANAAPLEHKSGSWVNKDYAIRGEWSIEQRDSQHVIIFNQNFKTKNGPDLKVFLSTQTIDNVNGKNATDNAQLVAVLKKNKGSQEYVLPANIDINNFKSLLIHCEAYSVLWGGANL